MAVSNRMSVATIDSPEFLNITSISPLISKCEIKVLYVGDNRNGSYITKEVASKMAETLPGTPIVGYYLDNKEDFGDHGEQVIIDIEGVKFKSLTKPYGFVAPDSKIWFQKFEDTDEFGNVEIREYLMTEGYLWTEQYEEAKRVIAEGNPQSMELDKNSLKGHWSTDNNRGVEFFIINDAIFSKLCILGEDVEPCFEGANITAPKISSSFTKNNNFTKSLFSMMEELKFALNNDKGGLSMEKQNTPVVEETMVEQTVENSFSAEDKPVKEVSVEINNTTEEFAKCDIEKEEEKKDPEKKDDEDKRDSKFEKKEDEEDKKDSPDSKEEPAKEEEEEEKKDDEEDKKKYSLMESELAELKIQYAALQEENNKLLAFKQEVEGRQKDDLIASFTMLSDEDKLDVVMNKDKYSLDDIEAKLSVICVRKKVIFAQDTAQETAKEEDPIITFNLDSHEADNVPAWIKAVEETKRNMK